MRDQDRLENEALEYAASLPAPAADPPMLALIARLATDPTVDVEKLRALLEMQERLEDRQKRAKFAEALARLQTRLPRVKKDGSIQFEEKAGRRPKPIKYAKWEDIDTAIRPLLAEEGFGLSFMTAPRAADGGGLIVTARLRHRNGHFEECSFPVPLDTGIRNNLQALGSSLSYGKRYSACAILNIVTEGDDDDGHAGGRERISADQIRELDDMRRSLGVDLDQFCRTLAVDSLIDLDVSAFPIAMNLLNARKRRKTNE